MMAIIKKPTIINLPITEICDSRCIMCNVWFAGKTDQFTPKNIEQTFKQSFFNKVKHIGISGGEPTLNDNLTEICIILLKSVPSLKTLSITSHGYHTDKHEKFLPVILDDCRNKNVSFSLNLSLDGIGEVHSKVRRIPNAFKKVTTTAEVAKGMGIPVQFQCTITPVNVYGIVHVREYAIENNYDVVFRIASYIARLSNDGLSERIKLSDKQRSFIADFLEAPRTILATKSLGRRLFYSDLAKRLKNDATRKAPCSFQSNALLLAPDLSIYNCSRSEVKLEINDRTQIAGSINSTNNRNILKNLLSDICPGCYHDQSGRWPIWNYFVVHNKFYFIFLLLNKLSKVPSIFKNILLPIKSGPSYIKNLDHVLIIGCYGGEHVGDAAILGGVILRLINKYSTKKITVLSIRHDRTTCWVNNLHIKDTLIDVIGIDENVDLKKYDALVLGGGPVMSIPILLSNHLSIIRKFKSKSKPFIIEGIGIGPLNSLPTKQMANKILKSADSISVRTDKDVLIAKGYNLNVEKTTDPAFDYLQQLEFLNFKPHPTLEGIINTDKDIWVINLRPLWNKYSGENDVLVSIEEQIIVSISQLVDCFKENRRFIFMPMNADQFGFSDLELAYKLEKQLKTYPSEIDFKIWEYEPDIDNCVFLLKKTQLTISMRFHGCIFSLANNIPTIGLDYSTSDKGKVYSLFQDCKMPDRVLNIRRIDFDSLLETVNKVIKN